MLKLVYSSKNQKKKYVVFYDNLRCLSNITCKSFKTIDEAIDFAWHDRDMFMGNVDTIYMDRMHEVEHPILYVKRWEFA
jgi:uncharacterized secreted protein with C-terminal beta-propeller domain